MLEESPNPKTAPDPAEIGPPAEAPAPGPTPDRPAEAAIAAPQPPHFGPIADPGQTSPPVAPAGAEAGLRYCPLCDDFVVPFGPKFRCPRHHVFLTQKTAGADDSRRKKILRDLIDEFSPTTGAHRRSIEQLAKTVWRLEFVRPGTTEWQRLIAGRRELEAELAPVADTDSQLDTAAELSKLSRAELAEELHHLADELADEETPPIAEERHAPATPLPEPREDRASIGEPVCAYCGRACVGESHPSFATLHGLDPAEIAKRDALRTKEMFENIRRAQ